MATKIPKFSIGDRVRVIQGLFDGRVGVVQSHVKNVIGAKDPHHDYYEVRLDTIVNKSIYARHLEPVAPLSPVEAAATKWCKSFMRKQARA